MFLTVVHTRAMWSDTPWRVVEAMLLSQQKCTSLSPLPVTVMDNRTWHLRTRAPRKFATSSSAPRTRPILLCAMASTKSWGSADCRTVSFFSLSPWIVKGSVFFIVNWAGNWQQIVKLIGSIPEEKIYGAKCQDGICYELVNVRLWGKLGYELGKGNLRIVLAPISLPWQWLAGQNVACNLAKEQHNSSLFF